MRWPALACLFLVSCGPVADGPDAGDGTFIAFESDFDGFTSWQSYFVDGGIAESSSHLAGDRTIYLNHLPAHGAVVFPLGTVLVKTLADSGQIFAMAKRGGDFNDGGAAGWEWFELVGTPAHVVIHWRGLGPPAGEPYGGAGNSDCNNCHTGAWENDFVQSNLVNLGSF